MAIDFDYWYVIEAEKYLGGQIVVYLATEMFEFGLAPRPPGRYQN